MCNCSSVHRQPAAKPSGQPLAHQPSGVGTQLTALGAGSYCSALGLHHRSRETAAHRTSSLSFFPAVLLYVRKLILQTATKRERVWSDVLLLKVQPSDKPKRLNKGHRAQETRQGAV